MRGPRKEGGLSLFLVMAAVAAGAQEVPAAWGNLTPGPYPIGFRVFQEVDHTRGYWPLRDYRGEPRPFPTARPIQISVWYPSAPAPKRTPVHFEDYVTLQETALGEAQRESLRPGVIDELRNEIFRRYFPPDGPDDRQLESILRQRTAAVRDADWAEGRFPLIVHSGFGPFAQSVLLEYLASHGYVVVTTHMLGSDPAWFHRGADTIEWWQDTARDVAFLRAFARRFPSADVEKTAVIGMTAAAGILDQIDSMHHSAVVGIESSYPELLPRTPGFEPARVRIPILDIVSRGRTANEERLGHYVFADRWLVRMEDVDHVALYQFARLVDREHARADAGYDTAAKLARQFLDAHLKSPTPEASKSWNDVFEALAEEDAIVASHLPATPAIPTEQEFLLLVREGKMEQASAAYRAAVEGGHHRFFDGSQLRTVAMFRLFDDGDPRGAAEAFRILLDAYPGDAEGWRFLARSLSALGDLPGAREALQSAIAAVEELEVPDEEKKRLLERIERDRSAIDPPE